jgi:hypothetical protein
MNKQFPERSLSPSALDRLSAYNQAHHGHPRSSATEANLKSKPVKPFSNNAQQSRFSAAAAADPSARVLTSSQSKSKINKPASFSSMNLDKKTSFSSMKLDKKTSRKSVKGMEFQKTFVQHTKEPPKRKISGTALFSGKSSARTLSTTRTSSARISAYKESIGKLHRDDPSFIVPLLASRAYYIPGNSWCQDWMQFMTNNHPLFGICCHHKLHPIKSCTRIVALLGSFLFGLAMTNMFYLWYIWNPEFDQEVVSMTTTSGGIWTLTTGMLLLWTLGGGIHASFNLLIWYIAACSCCRPGGCLENRACCPSFGKHSIRVMVVVIAIIAVFIVLMRVAIGNADTDLDDTNANDFDFFFTSEAWDFKIEKGEEFDFVMAYMVQMISSLFLFYPLLATMLMFGVPGCRSFPLIGGRPYEVNQWERRMNRYNKEEDWELCAQPTIANSEGSGDHMNASERGSCHEDDIELVISPKAGQWI